jgi:mycofactocin system creatininase family protein
LPQLDDLTWPQVAEYAEQGCLLAVPLGSTEQHGPHLPLSTDADVAVALCEALAAARADVLVAPAIRYGASGEHAGFAGTLSIGQEALELLLVELGRSASETFDRMVLVNAHGGNAEPLRRATALLRSESRDVLAWMPRWKGDAHAGFVETSLQLELDRSRVRLDRAEAGATEPIGELMPGLRSGGVRSVSPNGVLGDPAGASAEDGRAILGALVRDLIATVTEWAGPVGSVS